LEACDKVIVNQNWI